MPECDEEPEPCETGNEILDSPSFQYLMQQAAEVSGFEEDESEREEGFWAVFEENGSFTKELFPYSSRSSCHFSISGTMSQLMQLLNNAVAILHTHPYQPFENVYQQECLDYLSSIGMDISNGLRYLIGPSQNDLSILNFIDSNLNIDLPLITIDPWLIYIDEPTNAEQGESDDYNRCGY